MSRFNAPKNHPQQVKRRGDQTTALFETTQSTTDEVDTRETNDQLWRELDAEFHFTIDVAANSANTKCERFYDREVDGLEQDWDGEVVWCNPPYSAIPNWVRKATKSRAITVMLLPANRTEQGWWQAHIEPDRDKGRHIETRFLSGRRAFTHTNGKSAGHVPFGSVLVIFRGTKNEVPVIFRRLPHD